MNVQAYISSGIIESYVLGLASPEEQAEFEQMAAQYPEVLQARLDFEIVLERNAMDAAIAPPAELKTRIQSALPATISRDGTLHRPVPYEAPVRRMNFWKYAAAASVLLLVGSIIWSISLLTDNRKLQNQFRQSATELNSAQRKIDTLARDLAVITQNPNMRMAVMKGLEAAPQAFATVYWDTTSHDVYLMASNLPIPASDKQYQLWAMFNGKPVDLGVFDVKREKLLIQAKNAQGAEAFAITLEERGGSPQPRGTMYVLGKL